AATWSGEQVTVMLATSRNREQVGRHHGGERTEDSDLGWQTVDGPAAEASVRRLRQRIFTRACLTPHRPTAEGQDQPTCHAADCLLARRVVGAGRITWGD